MDDSAADDVDAIRVVPDKSYNPNGNSDRHQPKQQQRRERSSTSSRERQLRKQQQKKQRKTTTHKRERDVPPQQQHRRSHRHHRGPYHDGEGGEFEGVDENGDPGEQYFMDLAGNIKRVCG